uniref:PiggyBac transposable element-derived protein domain-containing protein n=1 Tax=Magallana gigas TaxID=29159 RepID=A0A8W8NTV8_MAGGI
MKMFLYDKLTRVRRLLEQVESISQSLFQPYESVSVDERMVASKHQYSGIRQFIRDKPIPFGLKLWVLADSITGYTYAFFVYLGKKRTELNNRTKGLSYNVGMELSKKLVNQGYRIYTDSFYTTQHLATDLLQKKTYLIGAVKRTSSAMPQCLKDIELFEKVSSRGDFRWHREGDFVYVQWRDCKTVTIISPIHKGSSIGQCQLTEFMKDKVNVSSVHGVSASFGQLEYRESLPMSLMGLDLNRQLAPSPKPSVDQCLPMISENRRDCICCNGEASMLGQKVPSTKTHYYCSKCEVPLCL